MVDQSMTPEEQLLRLIESGGKGNSGKKESKGFAFLNLKAWSGLFSGSGVEAKQPSRNRLVSGLLPRELSLKLVNRLLIILLVFVLAGIAYNMSKVRATVENLSGQVAASRPSAGTQQALASLNPGQHENEKDDKETIDQLEAEISGDQPRDEPDPGWLLGLYPATGEKACPRLQVQERKPLRLLLPGFTLSPGLDEP